MTEEKFGKTFLNNKADIENELKGLKIFDNDLLDDTYIDLFEWSQSNEILDFKNTFLSFYNKRHKRLTDRDVHFTNVTPQEMLKYDRIDTGSENVEYNEWIGQRVDKIIEYVDSVVFPHEHKPELNRQVLHMWLDGMTFEQIGAELGMDANSALHIKDRMIEKIRKHIKNMPK